MTRPSSCLCASRSSAARVILAALSANGTARHRGNSSAASATRRSTSCPECGSKTRSVSPLAGLTEAIREVMSAPAYPHLAPFEHLEEELVRHGGLGAEDPRRRERAAGQELTRDRQRHAGVQGTGGDPPAWVGEDRQRAPPADGLPLRAALEVDPKDVAVGGISRRGGLPRRQREQDLARRGARGESLARRKPELHEKCDLARELGLEGDL